jgi:hypothetical protein
MHVTLAEACGAECCMYWQPPARQSHCVVSHVCRGAGTDANVFIELHGAKGSAGEVRLDNASNNFERGRVDCFKISASDVGELQRCVVRWGRSSGCTAAVVRWGRSAGCTAAVAGWDAAGREWRDIREGWPHGNSQVHHGRTRLQPGHLHGSSRVPYERLVLHAAGWDVCMPMM